MAQRKLTAEQLRKFRTAVSTLKKKGLVKKSIDARNAQPYQLSEGKSLRELVKKFDDVISEKVEPVKLPKKKVADYKRAGYETYKDRVLVPKLANDKVTVTKDDEIKVTDKRTKIQHIKLAVPYRNLRQWLQDMQKDSLRINAMKRRNEFFGYKIGHNHSWNLYRTIEFLIDEIENGSPSGLNLSEKIRTTTHKQQNEFFEAFEIVRVPRAESWPQPKNRFRGGGRRAKTGKRRKLTEEQKAENRRKNAERQAKYRATLSKREKDDYKKKAKKRAKKSRKKTSKK